jgi:hypothetical protein
MMTGNPEPRIRLLSGPGYVHLQKNLGFRTGVMDRASVFLSVSSGRMSGEMVAARLAGPAPQWPESGRGRLPSAEKEG